MVCGFIESSEFLFAPLFRSLPELLVERADEDRSARLIASTVREILALVDAARPGTQMMLGRLMELLFVEVLRRHASPPAGRQQGLVRRAQRSGGRPRARARARRTRPTLDRG